MNQGGQATLVAGNGGYGYGGDGGPATAARLAYPAHVAVGSDGSLYFNDSDTYRVRRVGPDGLISTLAGNGGYGFAGDGGAATEASLTSYIGLAVAPDGRVYLGDADNRRVRLVGQPNAPGAAPAPSAAQAAAHAQ
jgi:hypothetical protein